MEKIVWQADGVVHEYLGLSKTFGLVPTPVPQFLMENVGMWKINIYKIIKFIKCTLIFGFNLGSEVYYGSPSSVYPIYVCNINLVLGFKMY